jgi:hypothetical protein
MNSLSTLVRRRGPAAFAVGVAAAVAAALVAFGAATPAAATPAVVKAAPAVQTGAVGQPGPAGVAVPAAVSSGSSKDNVATATITGVRAAAIGQLSLRFYWGTRNGCWNLNLSGLPVFAGQAVVASATESDGASNEFVGAATMTVSNVSVINGTVSVHVCIGWDTPINLWIHYLG